LPLLSNKYAKQEADVAKKVSGVIYPTPWACKEAELRFGIPASKVILVPFGANSYCTSNDEEVLSRIHKRKLEQLNFLYIGKDWERKGGPLALSIVRKINESGCPATLHIIGCNPPIDEVSLNYVRLYGYLSPESPEDRTVMMNAFSQADFFLVPSYAECFGLVFAEAQSYGLPCISLNSHGIPGVVENGATGLLFDSHIPVELMVSEIIQLIRNRDAYLAMAVAARMKFKNYLNWDVFGSRIYEVFTKYSTL
jgi:glycosyltransferase involved in cell wall biosynthesis